VPFHPKRLYDFLDEYFVLVLHMPDDDEGSEGAAEGDQEPEDEDEPQDLEAKRTDALGKARARFGTVLRSKGFMWLAHESTISLTWSHAGAMLNVDGGHQWFAGQDPTAWPPETRTAIEMDFEGEHGDRRQELVFIGADMNQGALTACLDECLLTDAELALGPTEWTTAFEHEWPLWRPEDDADETDPADGAAPASAEPHVHGPACGTSGHSH
jgi:hypothetical protein